jgi:hypothetical protein
VRAEKDPWELQGNRQQPGSVPLGPGKNLVSEDSGHAREERMGAFIEVDELVTELKLVRRLGVAGVPLERIKSLEVLIQRLFPDVQQNYRKARLRETLVRGMKRLDGPHERGIGISLGLHPDYDTKNSGYRREHFAAHYNLSAESVRRRGGIEEQVFEILARALLSLSPPTSSPPLNSHQEVSSSPTRDDLTASDFKNNQFRISRSPSAYRDLIGELESSARRIDSFPKRLSVVFKSDRAIEQIALQRFGRGSSMIEPYVEEHILRRKTFYDNLASGTIVREIYIADDLRNYLLHGRHGKDVTLSRDDLVESLHLWRECIENYPDNYLVAFTSERIPFKYEVIDGRAIVMHEAISGNDRDRLNAFAVLHEEFAGAFHRDFELVWERTPTENRSLERILGFIAELYQVEESG